MLKQTVKRMNELNDTSRKCLYEEYKEWIDGLGEKGKGQDAIIFRYIGNTQIS